MYQLKLLIYINKVMINYLFFTLLFADVSNIWCTITFVMFTQGICACFLRKCATTGLFSTGLEHS